MPEEELSPYLSKTPCCHNEIPCLPYQLPPLCNQPREDLKPLGVAEGVEEAKEAAVEEAAEPLHRLEDNQCNREQLNYQTTQFQQDLLELWRHSTETGQTPTCS